MDLEVLGACIEMHPFWFCSRFCDHFRSTWQEPGSTPGALRVLPHETLALLVSVCSHFTENKTRRG